MKMMKAGWIAMGVLAAGLLVPGSAWADRSTSLRGNRLIEDADDVFTYPHLTTQYKDRVTFDLGTSDAQGNGLFLMDGGNFTWGVALHRGNIFDAASITRLNEQNALNPLAVPGVGPINLGGAVPAPLTVADVLLGFGDLGFRLSLGTGFDSSTDVDDNETSEGVQFGNLAVSFGGVENFDMALHLGLIMGDTVAGGDTTAEATQIRAAATVRGYIPRNELLSMGVVGRLGFVTTSADEIAGNNTTTASASTFDAVVGAGPAIALANNAKIAAYATLGFETTSFDPDDGEENDSSSAQSILLPGANVAFEVFLTDWLVARAGMEYNHRINMGGQVQPNGETSTSSNAKGFGWNAGVGIVKGAFRLDGTFNPSFLTQGPDFIGGDGALFTFVSASYLFGDASREPIAPATVEPAPAAPPRYEPAPAVENAPPATPNY